MSSSFMVLASSVLSGRFGALGACSRPVPVDRLDNVVSVTSTTYVLLVDGAGSGLLPVFLDKQGWGAIVSECEEPMTERTDWEDVGRDGGFTRVVFASSLELTARYLLMVGVRGATNLRADKQ